nr:icarapin-like isoform X1 [Megalopta genalis]
MFLLLGPVSRQFEDRCSLVEVSTSTDVESTASRYSEDASRRVPVNCAREDDSDERKYVDPFFEPVAFDIPDVNQEISQIYNQMYRWYLSMKDHLRGMMDPGLFGGPWSKIPKTANTTSTTKVIDGHVVVINETTYTDDEDGYKAVLRFSVIDIRPKNETNTAEEMTVSPVAEETDIPKNEVETLDA